MSYPLTIYGLMMSDRGRNRSLARAVAAVVQPGDVVVDVGAGAGFLSILAARAGARRVYAIEGTRMARVAEKLIEHNGCSDVVQIVHSWSHDWQPPELADVVLSETLGYAVLDEGFRKTVADARARFLKPDGRLVPESVDIYTVPIESPDLVVDADYIDTMEGLDFEPLGDMYRRLHQRTLVPFDCELGERALLAHIDCYEATADEVVRCTARTEIQRPGRLGAHAFWFDAALTPGIRLSSRDPRPANHWGQAILPCRSAGPVARGDIVELAATFDDRGRFAVEWETGVACGSQEQSPEVAR